VLVSEGVEDEALLGHEGVPVRRNPICDFRFSTPRI
jgi:hypothetical protein